jgi:hypothetical protein
MAFKEVRLCPLNGGDAKDWSYPKETLTIHLDPLEKHWSAGCNSRLHLLDFRLLKIASNHCHGMSVLSNFEANGSSDDPEISH